MINNNYHYHNMTRLLLITLIIFFSHPVISKEINLFTSRHYDSDFKLYKKFTQKTGIKVNVINGKSKVLEKRIYEEGKNSKADVLFLADAGALYSAQKKNLFTKIESKKINNKLPKNLKNDFWVAITKRARVLFYNPEKINKKDVQNISYEDLSNKRWKNSIAIRQANNIYNQSLIASILEYNGPKNTFIWLKDFVNNFVRSPQGNDRAQILLVASGEAKLAIANTYYYALMLSGKKGDDQKKAAEKVKPIFPNQNNRGTHINISGAGILKNSPNKENSLKFIEFLLTNEAQTHICNNSFEFPVIDNVKTNSFIDKIGKNFKEDNTISLSIYGERQTEAFKLMKKAGWN